MSKPTKAHRHSKRANNLSVNRRWKRINEAHNTSNRRGRRNVARVLAAAGEQA